MSALFLSAASIERVGADIASAAPSLTLLESHGTLSDEEIATIEIAYFSYDMVPNGVRRFFGALKKAPKLRWFHSLSAGIDDAIFTTLREQGARVTTSSGSTGVPIAQTILLYVLALNKGLPAWSDAQCRRSWEPHTRTDLSGSRMVVVGMGPIGIETARLAMAFGIEVVGVRRAPRGDEPCPTVAFAGLDTELARADHVVLALPLTDETRLLFDADRLARIKPGAAFYNVGRGDLVDENALIAALESGQLSGAGLDVFHTEPLPADSPLWTMPSVIVTPHNSGSVTGNTGRVDQIFLSNLRRYVAGEPLLNEVE